MNAKEYKQYVWDLKQNCTGANKEIKMQKIDGLQEILRLTKYLVLLQLMKVTATILTGIIQLTVGTITTTS